MDPCPGPERLGAYVERTPDAGARAALERHLARCTDCRNLVVALAGDGTPASRRPLAPWFAAAAALLLVATAFRGIPLESRPAKPDPSASRKLRAAWEPGESLLASKAVSRLLDDGSRIALDRGGDLLLKAPGRLVLRGGALWVRTGTGALEVEADGVRVRMLDGEAVLRMPVPGRQTGLWRDAEASASEGLTALALSGFVEILLPQGPIVLPAGWTLAGHATAPLPPVERAAWTGWLEPLRRIESRSGTSLEAWLGRSAALSAGASPARLPLPMPASSGTSLALRIATGGVRGDLGLAFPAGDRHACWILPAATLSSGTACLEIRREGDRVLFRLDDRTVGGADLDGAAATGPWADGPGLVLWGGSAELLEARSETWTEAP